MDSAKTAKRHGLFRRLTLLLAVTGAIILMIGFGLSAKECWFQFRAVKTTGKATDSSGEVDSRTHQPSIVYLIRFTTNTGKVTDFYEVVVGEPFADDAVLTVFYDPQNPNDARLSTPGRWEVPLQFLLAGGVIGCCAFGTRTVGKGKIPPPSMANQNESIAPVA